MPTENENVQTIVTECVDSLRRSLQKISQETEVSHMIVHRVLKWYKFHPYKLTIINGLRGDDFDQRVIFCEWTARLQISQIQFFLIFRLVTRHVIV
jgi:hypothetical protein